MRVRKPRRAQRHVGLVLELDVEGVPGDVVLRLHVYDPRDDGIEELRREICACVVLAGLALRRGQARARAVVSKDAGPVVGRVGS